MITPETIETLGQSFDESFTVIGLIILFIEIGKKLATHSLSRQGFMDMIASFFTQIPSIIVEVFIMSFAYAGYVLLAERFVSWTIPITLWTTLLALVICDLVYYWEHRIAHEVRVFWTQHAVHHSSRFMNPSVALRFGPFEGVISALFHLPLILLGFPPALVFFGILFVLAYQTWIHTELIGKLGILDAFLNTPSNHRVHHGCNDKYIDKNYGGVLIIWDRIFGTFQREEELPHYGLKRDFSSVNPLLVCISELPQFFRDLFNARSTQEFWIYMFGRPGRAPRPPETSESNHSNSELL